MATSKIGEMPLTYPEVEQYFARLNFYLIANKQTDCSKAVLLSSCGERAFSLISTLTAPEDLCADTVTYKDIRSSVIAHLKPRRILHYERHLLHTMTQNSGESISSFLERLKQQANKCEFGTLLEQLVLSQFIFGLTSSETRSKLLAVSHLTLQEAVQEAQLQETIISSDTVQPSAIAALRKGPSSNHRYVNSDRETWLRGNSTSFPPC